MDEFGKCSFCGTHCRVYLVNMDGPRICGNCADEAKKFADPISTTPAYPVREGKRHNAAPKFGPLPISDDVTPGGE